MKLGRTPVPASYLGKPRRLWTEDGAQWRWAPGTEVAAEVSDTRGGEPAGGLQESRDRQGPQRSTPDPAASCVSCQQPPCKCRGPRRLRSPGWGTARLRVPGQPGACWPHGRALHLPPPEARHEVPGAGGGAPTCDCTPEPAGEDTLRRHLRAALGGPPPSLDVLVERHASRASSWSAGSRDHRAAWVLQRSPSHGCASHHADGLRWRTWPRPPRGHTAGLSQLPAGLRRARRSQ